MPTPNEPKKHRTRFQKTVQWVTLIILFSFVSGSIIIGGLSFRSSQNMKTPSAVNVPEAKNGDEELMRWEEAVKLNPKDPFTLRNLARAQMRAGKFPEAKKTLLSAAKISPADPLTIELLGQLYLALGQGKEAVHALTKALTLKPNDLMLNYELALAYSLFGDEGKALHYYESVVAQGGDSREGVSARFAILQIYIHQANWKKAEAMGLSLEKAIPNNAQILTALVNVFQNEKNWSQAIFYAEKLKNADPSNSESSAKLAELYVKSGNLPEAEKIWTDLIAKNPKNPSYKYELALLDKKTGKLSEAKDLLERGKQEAADQHDDALKQKIEAESQGL